ncbi:MAG: choice-of-anchor X domain-containing protein [Acidobacteriota bacterium]
MKQSTTLLSSLALVLAALPLTMFPATAQAVGPQTEALDASVQPLAERAAAAHRAAARYPASSQPLAATALDPLVDERAVQPDTVVAPDGDGPTLVAWVTDTVVRVGTPVRIEARLDAPASSAPSLSTRAGHLAGLAADVVGSDGKVVAEALLLDDGTGADTIAGDGVYAARIALPAAAAPELAASYMVRVTHQTPRGEAQTAVVGFVYSNPWAELTGAFRDTVVDGSLVVEAEVEVRRAGRFHLAATLTDEDGAPVGLAQAAQRLETGRHWMPVSFYGLIFHERRANGPLVLGAATLTTTGGMPNALGPLLFDAHRLAARPLDAFTAAPYGDPTRLEAARRLEASVR